jgi:predicted dinucleotide-binding enzyme
MKVGIIGSGLVAQTLGQAFMAEKNEVMISSRHPDKEELKKWKSANT